MGNRINTADFAIDIIAADVLADFLERSIPAPVFVGEWETFRHDARPRVCFGLGDFTGAFGQSVTSRYALGLTLDRGPNQVARTMGALLQDIIVWVASPAPVNTPANQAKREARKSTWALALCTLGAMIRSHGGSTFPVSRGQWENEARAVTTHGAALQFTATFALPIPDDADELINIVRASCVHALDVDGTAVADSPDTSVG